MYGMSSYGLLQYAGEGSGNEAVDEFFVDLSRYVPPFLADIRELAELYRTEGFEVGLLRHNSQDLRDQCFMSTATWGLILWENMYGITTNLALSYEQRREILMAKCRGHGTTTMEMIRSTAAAFSGGEVAVIEFNKEHRFVVRFVGMKGIPQNMKSFVAMLEDIKPAHLTYSFEFSYTVWDNLASAAWETLGGMTWDLVKIMEGV